jgi:hypothetical protein
VSSVCEYGSWLHACGSRHAPVRCRSSSSWLLSWPYRVCVCARDGDMGVGGWQVMINMADAVAHFQATAASHDLADLVGVKHVWQRYTVCRCGWRGKGGERAGALARCCRSQSDSATCVVLGFVSRLTQIDVYTSCCLLLLLVAVAAGTLLTCLGLSAATGRPVSTCMQQMQLTLPCSWGHGVKWGTLQGTGCSSTRCAAQGVEQQWGPLYG